MWTFINKYRAVIITTVVIACVSFWLYSCDPVVNSILIPNLKVTRLELELELEQINGMAAVRLANLEQQEKFRQLIFENAMLLAMGSPLNPVGILTGIAAIFGLVSAGNSTVTAIKKYVINPKVNNG